MTASTNSKTAASNKITTAQLLIPLSLVTFTVMLLFAFQISQIVKDRDILNQTVGRLEAPVTESENLKKQFGGLVAGSEKLAKEGNKIAIDMVEKLKKAGVIVEPAAEVAPAPVPGARDVPPAGPKKP